MTWLEHLFALTCAQLPDRSPHFAGLVFPLCFRLAGLYLGVFASYLSIAASHGWRRRLSLHHGIPLAVLLLPLLIDGWGNTLHLWVTSGPVRALTGLSAGIALPMLLVSIDARGVAQAGDAVRSWVSGLAAAGLGLVLVGALIEPGSNRAFLALALAAAAGFLLLIANLLWAAGPSAWRRAGLRGEAG